MNTKFRSLLAAVVALSLALPGMAAADRRGHDRHGDYGDRHGHRYSQGHEKHYKKSYRDRHHDYRGHSDRYVTRYYQHDDDDDDLLVGLVVGGILGYALNGAQQGSRYEYTDRYPRAENNAYYPAESYAYSDGTCLQEREYQTTVVVGGKNVPAYGTACLQPDGSWKREPARPVSY